MYRFSNNSPAEQQMSVVKTRNIRSAYCLNSILNSLLLIAVYLFCPLANSEPLPSPLTLSQALSFADTGQPELALADANVAGAMARRYQVDADNSIEAYLELAPYMAVPSPEYNEDFTNDSYARLAVSKKLYDFGYSDSLQDSADAAIQSQELIASEIRNQHYLKIMRLFFNVIIADMHFAATNEKMTTLYLRYDKLRDAHSLGRVSDEALLRAESTYRDAANLRTQSEKQQYSSRQQLAIALNRPDDLPGELIKPELPQLDKAVPELTVLLDQAFANNLALASRLHEVQSATAALDAAKQQYGPTLSAGMELNHYERRLPGRSSASVGLTLNIPLLDGYRTQAETARLSAALSVAQARYENAKQQIRQQLVDLINRLEILSFKRNTDQIRLDSRALTLEKNRAAYELEMQTTLGTSMAQYTEAEWLSVKNDFEIALTWAQIDMITGKKLYQDKENKL